MHLDSHFVDPDLPGEGNFKIYLSDLPDGMSEEEAEDYSLWLLIEPEETEENKATFFAKMKAKCPSIREIRVITKAFDTAMHLMEDVEA